MEREGKEERRARRRRITVGIVVAVLVLLLVQSITITMPIRARVVDAESGKPVEGARVAALWSLKMMTPHSYDPGGEVRISYVKTGAKGELELPLTFIVHPPVAPFSLLLRPDDSMPWLVIAADDYAIAGATGAYGSDGLRHDPGFLSLRDSAINDSTIRLTPLPRSPSHRDIEQEEFQLSGAADDIERARSSCRRRTTCVGESVEEILYAIERRQEEIRMQRREQSREQGRFRNEKQNSQAWAGAAGVR